MRKERKAENVFITKDTLGIYFYTVLTYQLKNKDLDVAVTYREYYSDAPLQFPCWGERKKR